MEKVFNICWYLQFELRRLSVTLRTADLSHFDVSYISDHCLVLNTGETHTIYCAIESAEQEVM